MEREAVNKKRKNFSLAVVYLKKLFSFLFCCFQKLIPAGGSADNCCNCWHIFYNYFNMPELNLNQLKTLPTAEK